jgi:hydroxypyruvate isomerase
MLRFSANLGFLWAGLPLPEAIRAAHRAGFDAVECHWPYETPAEIVAAALRETGLPMISINTRMGVNGPKDFGVNALPGREAEARKYIDEAVAYAAAIGCLNINAAAGKSGGTPQAEAVLRGNLAYACDKAAPCGITVVLEPVNQRDAPGYHVSHVEKAIDTIKAVGAPNLKLMFDCYHTQIMQGDLTHRLEAAFSWLGHIQFAGVPRRQEPDEGEVNYPHVFATVEGLGWNGHLGAEYRPRGPTTESGLGWLAQWRRN